MLSKYGIYIDIKHLEIIVPETRENYRFIYLVIENFECQVHIKFIFIDQFSV